MKTLLEIFAASGFAVVLLNTYASVVWIPAAMIVGSLQLAAAIRYRFQHPRRSAAPPVPDQELALQHLTPSSPGLLLSVIHWIVTLSPLLLFVALWSMAWRAQVLIGHWPQVMADDPKWIGENDGLYQRLYDLTDLAFGITGWSMMIWAALYLGFHQRYTPGQRRAIAWIYIGAWILALWGTGCGIAWYLD